MNSPKPKRILIAPLDWGMGHTTRCVPIIQYLKKQGHQIILAGNKQQINWFKKSIDFVEYVDLEGYNIRYAASRFWFIPRLMLQIPNIFKTIKKEHLWLQQIIDEKQIDLVISDHRYGLFSSKVKSIFLTHQLQIISGWGSWADYFLLKFHFKMLSRFDEIGIIDVENINFSLAGRLSHPQKMPIKSVYWGWLSHLYQENIVSNKNEYILVLLSGIEPQRTRLQHLLWQQLASTKQKVHFVLGKSEFDKNQTCPENFIIHKEISSSELRDLMMNACLVVCRSGYSSIMDLVAVGQRALLIPTPGQTEQEYLGSFLKQKDSFEIVAENHLQLSENYINHLKKKLKYIVENDNNFTQFQLIIDKTLNNTDNKN